MPANRSLGKSLAYRAFRAARATFAEVITDNSGDNADERLALAIHTAKLKMDEFGIIRGHPLRPTLIAGIIACIRPGAFVTIAEGEDRQDHIAACNEQFGPREDTSSLPPAWWEHR